MNFSRRISIEQVEEGLQLAPKFDSDGLIPCITSSAETGEVLMLGYMNADALKQTILTGQAHYWSRSREMLWHKGADSGLVQHVVEMRIDDDQDAIWLRVSVAGLGASCHVGYKSCFFRRVMLDSQSNHDSSQTDNMLEFVEERKTFDPKQIYGDVPNPTKL